VVTQQTYLGLSYGQSDDRVFDETSDAYKIFIVNAMTQPEETDEFTADRHLETFLKFSKLERVDAVVVNTRMPPTDMLSRYLSQGQEPVTPDIGKIAKRGISVYAEDLIGDKGDFVRHDPDILTELLMRIASNEILPKL
jgi:uncharacterized cofD-like protein